MKKKFAAALVTGALAVAMVGGVASAAGHAAYGKTIKDATGSNYGQLKNSAWESGHAAPPAMGAKAFVESHLDD